MKYNDIFFDESLHPDIAINGRIHNGRSDKDVIMVITEPFNIRPHFYDLKNLKKYKGVITWNGKFYNKYKNDLNIRLYRGGQPIYQVCKLNNYTKFEDKIDGICAIGKFKKRKSIGDITHKRYEVMKEFEKFSSFTTHYYGWKQWGGNNYMGQIGIRDVIGGHIIGNGYHCSLDKIRTLSNYKFNLCFENCYHKFWSWGYITEKIICCFEARTIPIYLGCFNVEELLPCGTYIDFRKYKNFKDLVEYLSNITESEYNTIVTRAYDFKINTDINSIDNLILLYKEML